MPQNAPTRALGTSGLSAVITMRKRCDSIASKCLQIRLLVSKLLDEDWAADCFSRWRTREHVSDDIEEEGWVSWKQSRS